MATDPTTGQPFHENPPAEPDCYVCDWNGQELHIPIETGQTRRSMMSSVSGSRPVTVTRDTTAVPQPPARRRKRRRLRKRK